MPHPSAANAYPSGPNNYPSAPSRQTAVASGTLKSTGAASAPSVVRRAVASGSVSFSGSAAGANALVGAPGDNLVSFSGSADATARRFLYAFGYPTFTVDPIYLAAAGAATGAVSTSGVAAANLGIPNLSASGSLTTSPYANAISLPATNVIVTQAFAASVTANVSSAAGISAGGAQGFTVSVVANVAWRVTSTGVVSVGGEANAYTERPSAALGSVTSWGQAAAVRRVDASTTPGTVVVVGGAVQGGGTLATATGSMVTSSSATASTLYSTSATGTVKSSAVTTIVRTASGTLKTTAAVTGNKGFASQAAGVLSIAAAVDGRTVIDADTTANTVTFSGVVGAVIGTPASATGTLTSSGYANCIFFTPVFVQPAGPVKPQTDVPRLRLLVAQTTTGRVALDLPFTNLSWNAPLNKIGQCSATLPIEEVLDAAYAQGATNPRSTLREFLLGPYKFSLVVCYGNVAVFGGPLLPTEDEDESTVKIAGVGMERLLESRLLVKRAGADDLTAESRDVKLENGNPAGAVVKVVTEALTTYTASRPRGLPITCLNPPQGRGDENFSWLSYDLNNAWKAVSDLSARPDGPDVRLEPSLRQGSDGAFVTWDLQVGAPTFDVAPGSLGDQAPLPWVWDDQTSKITRSTDAVGLATDYFASGGGQDRAKKLALSTSDDLLRLDFPVLERADASAASDENERTIQLRADALRDAHSSPTDSWKLSVRGDGDPPLGSFRRGDVAKIEVRRKLLIESGDYLRRITEIAGTEDPSWVSVSCENEDGLVRA